MKITIHLQYFAELADNSGVKQEDIVISDSYSLEDLYSHLQMKHGFLIPFKELKIAINESFAESDAAIAQGDTVVFIPPVAGG